MSKFIEANQKGSTYINNKIFYDTKIPTTAKALYCIICSACYGDKDFCTPSQATLSKALGKSVRTVQRMLKILCKNNYISCKRRGSISSILTVVGKSASNKVKKAVDGVKRAYNQFKNKNKSKQWDYEGQRTYDYDELEKKLLGWTVEKDLDGSEYEQGCFT